MVDGFCLRLLRQDWEGLCQLWMVASRAMLPPTPTSPADAGQEVAVKTEQVEETKPAEAEAPEAAQTEQATLAEPEEPKLAEEKPAKKPKPPVLADNVPGRPLTSAQRQVIEAALPRPPAKAPPDTPH